MKSSHSTLRRGVSACAFIAALSSSASSFAQQALPTIDIGGASRRTAPGPATSRAPASGISGPAVAPSTDVLTVQTGDRITGYKTDRTVSVKLNKPILQIPISVQTVTRQTMDDQQATTLNQAIVANVSSTSPMPANCTLFQNFMIRGFQTGTLSMAQLYRNGVLVPNERCPSTANLQSIEVVKGPSAMLYGRIEPGGLVDMIVKRPLETPYYSVQQQGGSFGVARTTLDATGPLTEDKSWLYRVNAEYYHNPSFVDFASNDRWFGSATVTYHPTQNFKLNVDTEYQDLYYVDNNPNIPAIGYNAAPIPISRYLADPSITVNNPDHDMRRFAGYDWKYDLNEDWSVTNRFAYNNTRSIQSSMFLQCTNAPFLLAAPNALCAANLPFGQSIVGLNWGPIALRSIAGTLDLNGKFYTGSLQHVVLFGTDHVNTSQVGNLYQAGSAQSINIFAPIYTPFGLSRFLTPANGTAFIRKQDWQGFYAQDMISAFDDRVHFLIGGRYDNAYALSSAQSSNSAIINNALDRANVLGISVKDHFFSPRVGLVVQPTPWLSFYGNYTQSFGVNNGVTRSNTPLGSQQAIQWEGGAKAEFLDKRLLATVAYFDIKKYNMSQNAPNAPAALRGYVVDLLDAESLGVELDVTGKLDDNWSVIANYSHLSTHVTKGSTLPASDPFDVRTQAPVVGKRLPAVPDNIGSLWLKYDADGDFRGLSCGGGFTWSGNAWVDPANTFLSPAYTLVRAMAAYRFALGPTHVTAQVNADNLLGQTYYYGTSNFPGRFAGTAGTPRNIMGSLRVEF
ncbi:MAG: TonB-dependent siderophore receptor [Alphaproteobacteria bacterium]|nr:TonB-dependent siderophore receptor [Alphaproteobacteria bacterium]MBM3652366.1 TonB-dependent siderophore receptor [Alphaproteobacteria bacterium]